MILYKVELTMSSRLFGFLGLFTSIIGLFLPWLDYPGPIYYAYALAEVATLNYNIIGLHVGFWAILGTLVAAFGLFSENKYYLYDNVFRKSRSSKYTAVGGLLIIYDTCSVLSMYFLYYPVRYWYPQLGVGVIVTLVGGIIILLSSFIGMIEEGSFKLQLSEVQCSIHQRSEVQRSENSNDNAQKDINCPICNSKQDSSYPLNFCHHCGSHLKL